MCKIDPMFINEISIFTSLTSVVLDTARNNVEKIYFHDTINLSNKSEQKVNMCCVDLTQDPTVCFITSSLWQAFSTNSTDRNVGFPLYISASFFIYLPYELRRATLIFAIYTLALLK